METASNPENKELATQLMQQIRMFLALKHYKTDNTPAEVLERVYIGSIGAAMSKNKLKDLGITHVLTLIDKMNPMFPDEFVYKCVSITDSAESDIVSEVDECLNFIKTAVNQGGKVLVHCFAGRSRSGSVVVAYVMKESQMTYDDALKFVQEKREVVQPNPGFEAQLRNWELSK